jgi:hypothetical protein
MSVAVKCPYLDGRFERRAMMTVEEFIYKTRNLSSPLELFKFFHNAMVEEGYENSAFVRVKNQQMTTPVFYVEPEKFSQAYVELKLDADDDALKRVEKLHGYLCWDDIERLFETTAREREVSELCRELGVFSGVTFPLRAPDGQTDVFDISMRERNSPDRSRLELIRAKIFHVQSRYWDMVVCEAPAVDLSHYERPSCGIFGMTPAHCRALVLTEIAARRWELDLLELNLRLTKIAGEREISDLLSWGMISERSDEYRFKYFYGPTAIGAQHLKNCSLAPELRHNAWRQDVRRKEAPKI